MIIDHATKIEKLEEILGNMQSRWDEEASLLRTAQQRFADFELAASAIKAQLKLRARLDEVVQAATRQ